MKSRHWLVLIGGLLLVCLILSLGLLWPGQAAWAEIISDGTVIAVVDLRQDQQLRVTAPSGGENVVTVKEGKIAVTEASCPDHYCVRRGYCQGGREIVCLPNRLVIRFVMGTEVDAQTD